VNILYGVVGEGMGHATRSRVVLEHLLARGHVVRVVVSGRAHGFLEKTFAGRPAITIQEIEGLTLVYEGNRMTLRRSVLENLEHAPKSLLKNVEAYRVVAEDGFTPDVVVSDFESWAYLYGLRHRIPVVSIDNMQVLNRCRHEGLGKEALGAFRLARAAVKVKLPFAYHYIVASFFFPPVIKPRTTLVPPILRPEILAARREPGAHVLVYQTAASNEALVPLLETLPFEFRVYGMGRDERRGNVTLKPFSQEGFIDDLRTARAAIAGGGFSLMGEAVHLGVPMLSVPVEGQFEQELNARWLARLGYGGFTRALDRDTVAAFLGRVEEHAACLATYPRQGNEMLYAAVDEVIRRAASGEHAPDVIAAPSMAHHDPEAARRGRRPRRKGNTAA